MKYTDVLSLLDVFISFVKYVFIYKALKQVFIYSVRYYKVQIVESL